jgi:hypothetical protein
MTEPRRSTPAARPMGGPATRIRRVWRGLPPERRLAAGAALGLFVTLFLPWYQETVIPFGAIHASSALPSASLTGWASFSFVEAAVLLVAAGVLSLLFARGEGRAFHVPGGDGGVITAAGFWTGVLLVWRMFDKQGTTGHGQFVTTSGIEWGIFIALGVAALLAYAGTRIKLANEPEPPLPGEGPVRSRGAVGTAASAGAAAGTAAAGVASRRARRAERADEPRPRPTSDDEEVARPQRPPRPRPVGEPPPARGLDFDELEQIKFDEPPEPPTVRRRPETDDQLTLRLERPD